MKKKVIIILQKVYFFYSTVVFLTVFLMLYPIFFISVQLPSFHTLGHWCNRVWGYFVYFLCGIPFIVKKSQKKHTKPAVYCANHSSYIDIPSLYCTIFEDLQFIGKASLAKVPLFGYMYSRLHILVNRRVKESKHESVERAKSAIRQGKSIVLFPEGSISMHPEGKMIEFKDGAFKIAIDCQVPIVPVALPNNRIILPDIKTTTARWKPCIVSFLEPIDTKGMNHQHIPELKKRVFNTLQQELSKYCTT